MSRFPGMTIERKPPKKLCQKCALQGIRSPLHLFQLNDEEALLMCKNVECTFMPSANWESLIVKRSLSELSSSGNKKGLPSSSSSSALSYSTHSAPQFSSSTLKRKSRFASSVSTQPAGSGVSSTHLTKSSSDFLRTRSLASPAPLPTDLISKEKTERKTLVPLAPFLCGHAHTFSSFDTKKIENKRGQRPTLDCDDRTQIVSKLNQFKPVRTKDFSKSKVKSTTRVGIKRPSSSLDSDSFSSSSSSLGSRPTTPSIEAKPYACVGRRSVKQIVVPKDTLSRLIEGSLKLELVKQTDNTAQAVVLKPTSETINSTEHLPDPKLVASVNTPSINLAAECTRKQLASDLVTPEFVTGGSDCGETENLEITPVGSLHDFLKLRITPSGAVPSAALGDSSDSVQSHIDAINSHFQALSQAFGHDSSHMSLTLTDEKSRVFDSSSEGTVPKKD